MMKIFKIQTSVELLVSASCAALLSFGLYLQHVRGLEPCPMCVVQRYCLVMLMLLAALAALTGGRIKQGLRVLCVAVGLGGAFVAARQSWLQWYPPEVASCGRDFYGMIENYELSKSIPMIFRGSGDCSAIDWTFLGGSIANWSFVAFSLFTLIFVKIGSSKH